jgi:hypothetical protein
MKDVNTDGPDETWLSKHGGYAKDMTLRDYFAAKAMQAAIDTREEDLNEFCDWAYALADAMLDSRDASAQVSDQ